MYYCFILEDNVLNSWPLHIQCEYAKRIGRYCLASLKSQKIYGQTHQPIDLTGKKVLLRSSCENLFAGLQLLRQCGALLVESETEIHQIENWYLLNLTRRRIREITLSDIIHAECNAKLLCYLKDNEFVFLKSRNKGFSGVIRSSRIISHDSELTQYLQIKCKKYGSRLLISDFVPLKSDSLGTRESRHIVFNGKILNSSRMVHSIRHTVPRSHIRKAQEIVDWLNQRKNFPNSFVLDVGDFLHEEQVVIDIVELNPLSSSICYVNNSVFTYLLPELKEIQRQFWFGPEYCYDKSNHPQRYLQNRSTNRNYTLFSDERNDFV